MENYAKERNELLEAVQEPEKERSAPSNWALGAAIVFANLVFALLDIISSATVYWMTQFILYGVLTFLAGYVPLLLHEFLYVRAYASRNQKIIAGIGAFVALISIILIGIVAGIINMLGVDSVGLQTAEIATLAALVLISAFHAVLSVIYFYIDDGIVAKQKTAQTIARANFKAEQLEAGDKILKIIEKSIQDRKAISGRYGKGADEALSEILIQLGADKNRNGIPDVLERKQFNPQPRQEQPMHAYNATTDGNPNPNGRHPNQE